MPAKSIAGSRASPRKALRASQVSYSDAFEASSTTTISEAASVAVQRHFVRQLRQLTSKQLKQRAAITSEEQHDFDELTQMEKTEAISITTFESYRTQFEKDQERKKYYSSVWTDWFTEEHIEQILVEEELERHKIHLQECRMRSTLHKLSQMEEEPLMWRHALNMVVFAEMVRRVAFYRQELDAAMAMNIPGYDAELLTVEGISDRKLDWMKSECCPFRFADDCPFFPSRILESLRDARAALSACGHHYSHVHPNGTHSEMRNEKSLDSRGSVISTSAVGEAEDESLKKDEFLDKVETSGAAVQKSVVVAAPRPPPRHKASSLIPLDPHGIPTGSNSLTINRLPALSRANLIAIKSTLNQGHYKRSKCSILPGL